MNLKDKPVSYINAYERELIRADVDRNKLYDNIRLMTLPKWDFKQDIKDANPNLRTIIDTTPYNAIENAAISMSNSYPKIDISPLAPNPAEYERAEKCEQIAQTEMRKSNSRGTGNVLYDKARAALVYNFIPTRVDDLAYQFPRDRSVWSPLQKRAWSQGRFIRRVFDPRTVHVELSDMGLVAVCHAQIFRAIDVLKYWELFENTGMDNKGMIGAALQVMREKIRAQAPPMGPSGSTGLHFVSFDFISDDRILRHGYFTSAINTPVQDLIPGGSNEIIFTDGDNPMGFINWSIRIGGSRIETESQYQVNPLLAPLYWSGAWESLNIIQSVVLSEPIKRLQEAHQVQETQDGQRLPESNDGVIVARQGDKVQNLPPPQIDPTAMNIVGTLKETMSQETGANILGDITAARRTPFATLNAMVQIAEGRLDVQRHILAESEKDDILIMFRYGAFDKVPFSTFRTQNKGLNAAGKQLILMAGQEITVGPDDFDPDAMEITVEIKSKNPTDFQQEVLTGIQLHDKLHIPLSDVQERLGFENTNLIEQQWTKEQMDNTELTAMLQHIMAQQQMADQQAMQQSQQPPQGGEPGTSLPSAAGGISQTAMGATSGGQQLMQPSGGGNENATAGLTREQISGKDTNGSPIGAGG